MAQRVMVKNANPDRLSSREAMGIAIKRLRKRADLTQEKAAEALGVVVGSWRRYEWGERDLPLDKLEAIAQAIKTDRAALLEEQSLVLGVTPGPTALPPANRPASTTIRSAAELQMLPIRDRIQAGAWLQVDDSSQVPPRTYPAVRDPRFPNAQQWLSEVVGDSVNQLNIFDGDLVHCVDATDIGYFPKTRDVVEVERRRFDGQEVELTLKEVEVTPSGVLFWPRSTNPRWRDPIELREGVKDGEDVEVRVRSVVIASIRRF